MKHFLEYTLLKLFAALVRPVPFGIAMRIGSFLGTVLYHVYPYRKDLAILNIKTAFPDISNERAVEIYRESCRNMAMMIFEYLKVYYLSDERIVSLVDLDGEDVLQEYLANSTGGVATSGHLGSFELFATYLNIRGMPVTGVAKPMRNPRSEQFLDEIRAAGRMELLKTTDGFKTIMKAIMAGKVIGLVADQDAGENGVMVDFFGISSSTAAGPAVLTHRNNTPVFGAYMIRTGPTKYQAFLRKIDLSDLPEDLDQKITEITQRHTRELESFVRRFPEHYFWFHKRWRTSGLYRKQKI